MSYIAKPDDQNDSESALITSLDSIPPSSDVQFLRKATASTIINASVLAGTGISIVGTPTSITISTSGTFGHTIQDEGISLTTRTNLNFIGAGVTATDNAGTNSTDVTISSAPGGSDTQVQFNDGGSFGGDAGLTYNKTTNTLTVPFVTSLGNLEFTSANATVANGFNLILNAGIAISGGDGGSVSVFAGNGEGAGTGGQFSVISGFGGATGAGGQIRFIAGDGGATSGDGGSIVFEAGPTHGGDSNGGNISLVPSESQGLGTFGRIKFFHKVGSPAAVFDISLLSIDQTFAFPDASGTIALTTGVGNSFSTIDCPAGTDPVADSITDTLTLSNGAGISITGDSSTDTVTIASTITQYTNALAQAAAGWQDDGTVVRLVGTTDEVVIGGTAALSSAKVSIDGDTDQIQLIIQGNGTQTTDLFVLETSAGTDLFNFSNAGNLTVATTGKIQFTDTNAFINASSSGNLVVQGATLTTVGVAGDIQLGDGTTRDMYPQTNEKINLGTVSSRFLNVRLGGDLDLDEGSNMLVGTTTGTKIGTSTSSKIGFFNSTPIVQPSSTTDLRQALINLGLYATGGATPLDLNGGNAIVNAITINADSTIADGVDFALNTTTGSKFGTATTQKIGFLGATPQPQVGSVGDIKDMLVNFGFIANGGATPLNLDGGAVGCGTITLIDGANIVVNATTGTRIGTATTQKLAFYNATPVVQPAAYTPSNVTTDRSYNANATTLDEVADVLGTLIADLQSLGLVG